jgi:membrane-bound lytic murein transglycosylase F
MKVKHNALNFTFKFVEWRTRSKRSTALIFLLGLILMATSGFDLLPFQESEALLRAKHFQPVEILVLENPLSTVKDRTGSNWGIDQERLQSFAKYTGLQIKTVIFKKPEDLIKAYNNGRGQIVISRQHLELDEVVLGPLFEEIRNGIFCRRNLKITSGEDLAGLKFIDGKWPMQKDIKAIEDKKADCLVAELREGLFATQTYFNITKVGEVPTNFHYAWYVRHINYDLRDLLNSWYHKTIRNGEFTNIDHRFEMSLKTLGRSEVRNMLEDMSTLLPQYQSAFKEVGSEVKLPWTLIAAVAYQESKWNHTAVSFTGVRGLMQLTMQTAEHMGITDREDPFQSIWGGASYLKHLWQEWAEIRNPRDRMLVTLASYNAGIAHIYDVMEILKHEGLDPYQWQNIETVLPRLEDPKICEELPYGCARGNETVDFVKRSFSYYQILSLKR